MPPVRSETASTYHRWGAVTTVSAIKRGRTPLLKLVLWFGRQTEVATGPRLSCPRPLSR